MPQETPIETRLAQAARLLQVDPAQAQAQLRDILAVHPKHPFARLLFGASHNRLGDELDALAVLEPLLDAQPRFAEAHYEAGVALGKAGRYDEAVDALQTATGLKPELAQAWRVLAALHAQHGNPRAATLATSQLQYCAREPRLLRAAEAIAEQQFPQAEALLREHLRNNANDPQAMRLVARLASEAGAHEDAARMLQNCLRQLPDFLTARFELALALQQLKMPREALAETETLLREDPDNSAACYLKAELLHGLGDHDGAADLLSALAQRHGERSRVWVSLGNALKYAGRQAEAVQALRTALEKLPGLGEAWWELANLKTYRFDDADIAAMQAQVERPALADKHRAPIEFSLGKAYEDRGDHAASFRHYAQGNAVRRRQLPYDAAAETANVQRAKQLYTPEFFAARSGWGSAARDPIFIVGLPRSGSTLVEQILASHSQVEGTAELPTMNAIAQRLTKGKPYHDAVIALDADECRRIGEYYLGRTRDYRSTDAPLFTDKMPHNFAHVALIRLALPNARIIDVRRDPMAWGFSVFKQWFAGGATYSYDLADIGRYYRDYVELMAHFDAVLPGRVHRVRYEALVDDFETEVRKLLDYCALPFEPQCLRFFENARPVRTASSEQVRQPLYRDALEQWRHYAPWLGPLAEALNPDLK
ncbi:tetratricopeptide repeat-containing sulfotransferase family protein [Thermomonas sp. HDW16]|uniref:tetratricopeptide repeat-containing sulfotransferase family protein n=1 Tax=Thermomonas sp. HDW16 TaxID=2714945 RepID=UPI001F0F00B0|nr:tetratricopeptide repeat-containing sulfotransferase family protein [Thermomonas sp. HDW16]